MFTVSPVDSGVRAGEEIVSSPHVSQRLRVAPTGAGERASGGPTCNFGERGQRGERTEPREGPRKGCGDGENGTRGEGWRVGCRCVGEDPASARWGLSGGGGWG